MVNSTLSTQRKLCTFRVGDLYLGVDVLDVQEVLYHQEITEVPGSHETVSGLINLRGQVAAALDLRVRFKLPRREDGGQPVHVVVRSNGEAVSLLVDEIIDVTDVQLDDFEEAPDTVPAATRELIKGAYKLENRLLFTLDIDRTVQLDPFFTSEDH